MKLGQIEQVTNSTTTKNKKKNKKKNPVVLQVLYVLFFLFYVLPPSLSNPQGETTFGRRRHFLLSVSKPLMPGQLAHISLDKRLTIIWLLKLQGIFSQDVLAGVKIGFA